MIKNHGKSIVLKDDVNNIGLLGFFERYDTMYCAMVILILFFIMIQHSDEGIGQHAIIV